MSDTLSAFAASDGTEGLPWVGLDVPARRRACPEGLLLFDRLLQLAQVDSVLYPPEDHPSLRRFLAAIDDSATFDTLKRNCLVYYLLKDFNDGREAEFARKKHLPKRFVASTDAYWLFDNREHRLGCKRLCAPGVVPDFMPAILRMIQSLGDQREASQLTVDIVKYQSPDLSDIEDAKIVLAAYLQLGKAVEAVALARTVAAGSVNREGPEEGDNEESTQKVTVLIQCIFNSCFLAVPAFDKSLDKLLYTPLSGEEDDIMMQWLAEALASNSDLPEENLPLLTEWITGRLMAQGRFIDAITLLSGSANTLRRSAPAHKRAQDVLADLQSTLLPIQRSLVDVNLSRAASQGKKQPKASTSTAPASITQLPWQAGPNMPVLPAPRSLVQARANKAWLDEMKQGGKPLNRNQDLPLSAGGLLRPSSANQGGVSRQQGKHDERMDIWSAVQQSASPTKARNAGHSIAGPGSPIVRTGTPGRFGSQADGRSGSPFTAASSTAAMSARKPTVPGFGLVRPVPSASRAQVTQLDFSEAMRKAQNRGTQQASSSTQPAQARQEPQAYDMPFKPPKQKKLPPGAFPSSASVAGTNTTNTDDEDTHQSDDDTFSDIGDINIPGSVQKSSARPPPGVTATDFAAPPARSTRAARRQSSVIPEEPVTSSTPRTDRKTRQRTASTRDIAAPTPSKKGKTSNMSTSKSTSTVPRRSRRLGSVAPSEPDYPVMDMPGADDSVENSMMDKGSGRGGTGRTPRRRRP